MLQYLRYVVSIYRTFFMILVTPVMLLEYLEKETGREYGIGLKEKAILALRMARNVKTIPTLAFFFEHVTMATRILRIPRSTSGCVVECGCYAGGSTANLSLVCSLVGRRLEVFDSFRGLPIVSEQDLTNTMFEGKKVTYVPGQYHGGLDKVKTNVSRWGSVRSCRFNVGFFDETLPGCKEDCAFIFLDVDLRSSLETCVEHLWPLLQEQCYLFTHEAREIEIASFFYDKEWWNETLGSDPPGLVGAGSRLGLVPHKGVFNSELAFTIKGAP